MSVKSNLQQARKWEYNAMVARQSGQTDIADRYESMARMATIDAGIDFSNMNSTVGTSSTPQYTNYNNVSGSSSSTAKISFKDPLVICSFISSVLIVIACFVFGSMA